MADDERVAYVIGPSRDPHGLPDHPQYFEDGKRVYPCRCGETHRGAYACEDWNHHNCFHDASPLVLVAEDMPDYLMCMDCGQTFWLDREEQKPDA